MLVAHCASAPARPSAQEISAAATEPPPSRGDLQEILITARRREESLALTPVAVAVLGSTDLVRQAILSEQDLRFAAPGLSVRASSNSNQLNYAIRGQSLDAFSDTRPGVLPYFNEVQVSGDGGSSAFYDLQSVQVLKGPQGTLFGRDATGGAVLITSQKPQKTTGGYLRGGGGNYGFGTAEGAINAPIVTDVLFGRLAGLLQSRKGYQYNLFGNRNTGALHRYGIRGSLTWDRGMGLKNELVIDYAHFRGGSTVDVLWNLKPDAPTPAASALLYSPALDTLFGSPGAFAAVRAAHPGVSPLGISGDLAAQQARGPFLVNFDGANLYRSNNTIVSNITAFDLSGRTQLRNVLGLTKSGSENMSDIDSTPYLIDGNDLQNSSDVLSEELQVLGEVATGRLTYLVGGYLSREKAAYYSVARLVGLEPLVPASKQTNNYSKRQVTYSAYGQGSYDLSAATNVEGLAVTAGVRFTSEKANLDILPADVNFSLATTGLRDAAGIEVLPRGAFDNSQSKTTGNVSWTLGVQRQLNARLLIFATSRRGYKNAGFNGLVSPVVGLSATGGNGFATETVTDLELGMKYQGTVDNLPVRIDIVGYVNWITDAQHAAFTFVRGNPAVITVNVPGAKVSGVEIEGRGSPVRWLSIGATLNYTHARFTENRVRVQGVATEFGPYPDTPQASGAVFGEIEIPVSYSQSLLLRGEFYSQQSAVFTSTQNNNTGAKLPGYGVANILCSLEAGRAGWSLTINLKNAFNKVYYVGGVAPAEVLQFNTAIPGAPRTVSVEGRYHF